MPDTWGVNGVVATVGLDSVELQAMRLTLARDHVRKAALQDYDPGKAPVEHVGVSLVRACADSMAFLESGPEQQAVDDTVGTLGTAEAQKVQLMTMHKSKGLEFRVVILMGLSEYGMSTQLGLDDYDTAVASRNLLYVAITRARDTVIFSSRRGLSLRPGKAAWEQYNGRPSFLLKALYEAFDVPVTINDEYESKDEHDSPSKDGSRRWPRPVPIANRGYPEVSVRALVTEGHPAPCNPGTTTSR